MGRIALATIRAYQVMISPYVGGPCRHMPTCSQYAQEAISRYGAIKGIWLSAKRLARCRPLGTSGYDPVP